MASGINPIGMLQGKVTASGALVVSLDGGAITGSSATITGQVLVGDGTKTAPSIAAINDPDTGIYFPNNSNTWVASAGDTDVVRIMTTPAVNLFQTAVLNWGSAGFTSADLVLSRGAANRLDLASGDSINLVLGSYLTAGDPVGYAVTAYGAGTAYALTNTAAAIDLGTTDPAIVLDKAGTYRIDGQIHVAYAGATVVAETATFKVRRTNNTAADLSALVVIDLPVATTLTYSYGIVVIPPFIYTTTAINDAITLFANVSAALGAGAINATAIGTSIIATRLS